MIKRTISILLASMLLLGIFAACGTKEEESESLKESETEIGEMTETILERTKDLSYLNLQSYRPRLHYSQEANAMNDPNGLWYDEVAKVYHLYYQYNPVGLTVASDTQWGHAVSKDLVNWIEKEPALKFQYLEDKTTLGYNWSGSCVVDEDNTSGFFDESTHPKQRVVALYTNLWIDNGNKQVQSVAYSTDGGYSFIHYENNPVIETGYNGEADFRDPKVVKYYDESYKNGYIWVMIIAGGVHQIYTSENLIDWTFNSAITNPFKGNELVRSECPDLFPMKVEGEDTEKWILSHSGSFFMIGELKKNEEGLLEFVGETPFHRFTTPNTAALQSFYNTADGRRVAVAWQADFSAVYTAGFEEKTWNGCHSLPMELSLKRNGEGELWLYAYPVAEVEAMRGKELVSLEDFGFKEGDADPLEGIRSKHFELLMTVEAKELSDLTLVLREGKDENVTLTLRKVSDKALKLKVNFRKSSDLLLPYEKVYEQDISVKDDGTAEIRLYCDGLAFELYANGGESILENVIFPKESSDGLSLTGSFKIKSLELWELKSIFGEIPKEGEAVIPENESKGVRGPVKELPEKYEKVTLPEDTVFCETVINNAYFVRGIPKGLSAIVDAWGSGDSRYDRGITFELAPKYANILRIEINKFGGGKTWKLMGGETVPIADSSHVYIYNGLPEDEDFGKRVNGCIKDIFDGGLAIMGNYVCLANLWAPAEEQAIPDGIYTVVLQNEKGRTIAFSSWIDPSFYDHTYTYNFK